MSGPELQHTIGQLASPPGCDPRLCTTLPLALLSLVMFRGFCEVQRLTPCDLELAESYSFVAFQLQTDSDALVCCWQN